MPNYQKMYILLFNAMTDALKALEHNESRLAKSIIVHAQQQTELLYVFAAAEQDN